MGGIFLRLVDFDESSINKYNATLKDAINILLSFIILPLIPKEGVILSNIIVLHIQDETKQTLF